ncbi:MAG: ABC transporter substrate binding protein [Thermodesulfobacteriota bacterium]|nr:ABC transporter substrate binding protein [Thermodesulfobacteriota bacterium]
MKNKFFLNGLFVIFALLFCNAAFGDTSKTVLIIQSYEKGHICGQPQEDGIIKAFQESDLKSGKDIEFYYFYMDTKKTYTTPAGIEQRGKLALEKVKKIQPDIVLVIDDNAIKTVMMPLIGSDIQVVFCGMNGQPEDYNMKKHFMDSRCKPGANVTGVYEKLYLVKSLGVMKAVLPGLKKVLGITDYSPTGNAITNQFKKEIKEETPSVAFELVRVKDFTEYKKVISRVNEDHEIGAIYPAALSLMTPEGTTYTAPDIFRWTIKNCDKPGMALNYFFSKLGILGGAAVDFKAMGHQAGAKAVKIIKGSRAGDLPIEDAEKYAIVFNLARAKELGINIPFEILGAADFVYEKIILK